MIAAAAVLNDNTFYRRVYIPNKNITNYGLLPYPLMCVLTKPFEYHLMPLLAHWCTPPTRSCCFPKSTRKCDMPCCSQIDWEKESIKRSIYVVCTRHVYKMLKFKVNYKILKTHLPTTVSKHVCFLLSDMPPNSVQTSQKDDGATTTTTTLTPKKDCLPDVFARFVA